MRAGYGRKATLGVRWAGLEELAYLLGLLKDGVMGKYRKGTYLIEFYQKDKEFIERVAELFEKITGRRPKIKYHKNCWRLRICSKELYERLMKIKEKLFKDMGITIEYLKGFYDAEGNITRNRIVLYQKDREELEKVKCFLKSLGIRTGKISWYKTVWGLPIYDKESRKKFLMIIGFRHPKKASPPP